MLCGGKRRELGFSRHIGPWISMAFRQMLSFSSPPSTSCSACNFPTWSMWRWKWISLIESSKLFLTSVRHLVSTISILHEIMSFMICIWLTLRSRDWGEQWRIWPNLKCRSTLKRYMNGSIHSLLLVQQLTLNKFTSLKSICLLVLLRELLCMPRTKIF